MKLEHGKIYTSRDGSRVALIEGPAKTARPNTVYSRQGDWYDSESGAFLFYNPKTGAHEPARMGNWRDLVELVREA